MTFDQIVEALNATGDTFKSIVATKDGYQSNAQSRHGSNSYACGFGKTPTEALIDLYESRTRPQLHKQMSLEDLE